MMMWNAFHTSTALEESIHNVLPYISVSRAFQGFSCITNESQHKGNKEKNMLLLISNTWFNKP